MCFSATADLVTGGAIVAIGVDALRHASRRAERMVASLPLLLGAHQLSESLVWSGLEGGVGEPVWRAALWIYLVIAFGVVPIFVPLAVGMLEPAAHRWRTAAFTAVGAAVAVTLLHAVVRGPVDAAIRGHHIEYSVDLWQGAVIVGLYVLATCGSLLVSRHAPVRWYGVANLGAVGLLAWLDQTAFISLWCAWAALTSVSIAIWLRSSGGTRRRWSFA
jgi:hypothetical protein